MYRTIENRVSIRATIADMNRLLIACLSFLICTTASADLTNEVRCREIGFSQSVENQDADAFRSFIDADARFVGSGVLRGVDAVAQGWSVFFAPDGPSIKWRPQFVEVLENGKLALSRGPYRTVSVDKDGNSVVRWGTFNSVWRLNDDGEWRVVFDAGGPEAGEPGDDIKAVLDSDGGC